jgi:hypothetical protein
MFGPARTKSTLLRRCRKYARSSWPRSELEPEQLIPWLVSMAAALREAGAPLLAPGQAKDLLKPTLYSGCRKSPEDWPETEAHLQ